MNILSDVARFVLIKATFFVRECWRVASWLIEGQFTEVVTDYHFSVNWQLTKWCWGGFENINWFAWSQLFSYFLEIDKLIGGLFICTSNQSNKSHDTIVFFHRFFQFPHNQNEDSAIQYFLHQNTYFTACCKKEKLTVDKCALKKIDTDKKFRILALLWQTC